MQKTEDMKVKFLGIIPNYSSKGMDLSPQEVAAFSGLLTFKGDSVDDLVVEAKEKGQDIDKKIKFILRKSSLRGHASMATMPVFCFTFEASKMIGSMLTGIKYSSALMHSGRRANVDRDKNVYPKSIRKNKKALEIYREASFLNIDTFNKLLEMEVIKDEAGKILHYGTYGTGIITLPVESLATFKREVENEEKWMPEEGRILLKKIEAELEKMGVDLLYATRNVAPKNTLPYPNLFKDPKRNNLVRDMASDMKLEGEEVKVLGIDSYLGKGFEERVIEIKNKQLELFGDKKKLKEGWKKLLNLKRNLIRDYANAFSIKSYSNVSWRIWRDKKRHRTATVVTESIYYLIEKTLKVIDKHEKEFNKTGDLLEDALNELDEFFAIPKKLRKNEEARKMYLKAVFVSMKAYEELIKEGAKERDAVFIIPRALRIRMVQEYDLYNVLDGYFPLRSCPTADEQVFYQTKDEISQIRKLLKEKGLKYLDFLIEPKCMAAGFCPEDETCGYIKGFVKDYDDKFHEEMKEDLEEKFQDELREIRG